MPLYFIHIHAYIDWNRPTWLSTYIPTCNAVNTLDDYNNYTMTRAHIHWKVTKLYNSSSLGNFFFLLNNLNHII